MQAFNAIEALSEKNVEVHVFCTEPARSTSLTGVTIHRAPFALAPWRSRYTWLRWLTGRFVYLNDHRLGLWASYQMDELKPNVCYLFTQVALESSLGATGGSAMCSRQSKRAYSQFSQNLPPESERWCSRSYTGHPTSKMVDRVERKYKSERIRVSSEWSKRSMIEGGVSGEKITAIGQPIDLNRFKAALRKPFAEGPLRICFVGSLDLRKGFVYLLRAIRAVGSERVELRIVGARATDGVVDF